MSVIRSHYSQKQAIENADYDSRKMMNTTQTSCGVSISLADVLTVAVNKKGQHTVI